VQPLDKIVYMVLIVNSLKLNLSRFINLLILLLFISCQGENKDFPSIISQNVLIEKNDSLEIIINNLPSEIFTSINFFDNNLNIVPLEFYNADIGSKTLKRRISISDLNYVFLSFRGFSLINNEHKSYWHMFVFDTKIKTLEFDYTFGDIVLKNKFEKEDFAEVEMIRNQYSIFESEFKKQRIDKIKYIENIENLFIQNNILFANSDEKLKKIFNEIEFLNSLSNADVTDKRIVEFLIQLDQPLFSSALNNLIFNYVEINKEEIFKIDDVYDNLSDEFKRLLTIELTRNLEKYKSKKYKSFDKNLEWLKKSNYYVENKIQIDENLILTANNKPLIKLGFFEVYTKEGKKATLNSILEMDHSDFYLIDFWASWCAPCIRDSKLIHDMKLPSNLKIINISMDKTTDREKWLLKSTELNLKNSYLFVESASNKEFIHEINLNLLPRYILIDNDYNVLDLNMISPSEGDFQTEIERLIKK